MALVYASYYLGLPPGARKLMEEVLQTTVSALYENAQRVYLLQQVEERTYGDVDYGIRKLEGGILLSCYAGGWWATLCWRSRYGQQMFDLHAATGNPPRRIDWSKLDDAHAFGKCSIHVRTKRSADPNDLDAGWYSPFHRIDLQHPLLHHLADAVGELSAPPGDPLAPPHDPESPGHV